MHEQECCDEAASHQWPICIVSLEECSSLMQNFMQTRCSAHSVILNATATQYTCSLISVCGPHWLFTHTHSCPLPLAARLHWCHANRSRCTNNGWPFSRQPSCTYAMENYPVMRQKEILPFVTTWMVTENLWLSWLRERQTLYDIIYMWSLKMANS